MGHPVRRLLRALAHLLAIAGLAACACPAAAIASSPTPEAFCPAGAAIVSGPPAADLFGPEARDASHATWCERYDETGRSIREGPYRDTYPSGRPRSRARFVADRLEGEVLILHENGRTWMHAQYRAGQRHGAYVLFSPRSAPWLSARFAAGRPEGTHTTYFETGGRAGESHYAAGTEHGVARTWYRDGQLRLELRVDRGVWNGRFASWHPNGAPERQGAYAPCPASAGAASCAHIGAARHGRWRTWYPNGQPRSEGAFDFGDRIPPWRAWRSDGRPVSLDRLEAMEREAANAAGLGATAPAARVAEP
jgi:antitoxin component YwqK of YwqJK toxin-antitoxin module